MYKAIAKRIEEIRFNTNGNLAVFFPSFELQENVFRYINNVKIFMQRPNMTSKAIEKLIEDFSNNSNAILFGVMGGLLSEGIDYKNNIIKGLIIVGIPLAKPNLEIEAKINYYEKLFGRGYDYAYFIPGIIKAVQAAGRAIRKETDKAFIVLMDSRYNWNKYKSIISQFLEVKNSKDMINQISLFTESI